MIQRILRSDVALGLAALVLASSLGACRKKEAPAPPLATPSVTLNHEKTPLGSPIDIRPTVDGFSEPSRAVRIFVATTDNTGI